MWWQLVAAAAVLLAWLLSAAGSVLRWLRIRKVALQLPGPTNTLPLLGDVPSLKGAPLEALMRLYARHGTPCRIWAGPRLYVLLSHPEDAKAVLGGGPCIDRDDYMMDVLRPFTGNGLLASRGEHWRMRRKVMSRVYNAKWLQRQYRWLSAVSERLVTVLRSLPGQDPVPQMRALTLDMVAGSVFGMRTRAVDRPAEGFSKDYQSAVSVLHHRVMNPTLLVLPFFKLTNLGRMQTKFIARMHHFIETTIDIYSNERSTKEESETDLHPTEEETMDDTSDRLAGSALEAMLKLTDDKTLLREELATLLIAGQDTTGAALCFLLQLLALHPEIQEAAAEDEDLRERAVREALRLFPPSPLVSRELKEDVFLPSCGLTLPAGCSAVVCALFTQRDPEFWPDPLTFDPDRFLPDACRDRHPFSYLPFGAGPRSCIGAKYAYLQMRAVLSKLLPAFRVTTEGTREDLEDLQLGMVISPKKGFNFRLVPRDRSLMRPGCA